MFLIGSPTSYSSVTNRWRDWWFSTDPAPSQRRLLQELDSEPIQKLLLMKPIV